VVRLRRSSQPPRPPPRRASGGQRHPTPRVPAVALGTLAGADAQPARRRDVLGQPGRGRGRPRRWRQRLGGLDRQHIRQLTGFQPAPQRRAVAVDLVGGHPAGRHPGHQRAFQHPPGQFGLGGEADLVGDAGDPAALRVGQPSFGQVQLPVDHAMPGRGGIRQVDGDLGVVDLAGGAGVLALHSDRAGAFLEVAGLVDHQHRTRVTQVLQQVGADVVADTLSWSQTAPASRCCRPSGVAWPACSASVQQFFLGRSASSPSTNARAWRRGSTRGNRPATRPSSSSSPACHLAGSTSTLWPAATV
jgi:hypothetical protein